MNIQGFVTVNFSQLAEIIDYLGGINIAVTEEAVSYTHLQKNRGVY